MSLFTDNLLVYSKERGKKDMKIRKVGAKCHYSQTIYLFMYIYMYLLVYVYV